MRCVCGASIRPLEIVDVPLTRRANDPIHPEDWIVDTNRLWKKPGALDVGNLSAFEDRPKHLWLESAAHPDKASGQFLLAQPKHQSLYLVRPTDLRIELSFEHNRFKNRDQRKTQAKFSYGGRSYRMSLTDPEFTARHCTTFPDLGAKATVVHPPCGDKCYICVSLTPEFNGYHYKVVATILELP